MWYCVVHLKMTDFDKKIIKNKCKHITKKYNSAWENYKEFKDWIGPSKKGYRYFYCKLCNCDYHGGITSIKLHNIVHQPKKTKLSSKIKAEAVELNEKNFNEVAGKKI